METDGEFKVRGSPNTSVAFGRHRKNKSPLPIWQWNVSRRLLLTWQKKWQHCQPFGFDIRRWGAARDEALETIYNDAGGDDLVLNKCFTIRAMADLSDILDRVKKMKEHPDFTPKNPYRCRSLVGAFAMTTAFHDESSAGWRGPD
jgi:hypothetical protein